jgi:hypothetical protein
VSRLSTDRLYVSLEPEAVSVCRVRGLWKDKVIEKQLLECDPAYGSAPWHGAVDALRRHLDPLKAVRLKATVVLSNRLVRYAIVPFDAAVSGADEERALARFHLTRIYGERAKSWDLRLGDAQPGRPRLACALDEGLLAALRACFPAGRGPRLASVQPWLMAAFNRWRGALGRDSAWLVLLERERACFALASGEGWRSVQSLRMEQEQDLFTLLEREALRVGGTPPRKALVCGGRPAAEAGWQVAYAPLEGQHAMALSAL